jgi:hypothetical protein
MSLHYVLKRLSEQRDHIGLAQEPTPMVRDQGKKIGAARYSCSAILYRLEIGFHASTQATSLGTWKEF